MAETLQAWMDLKARLHDRLASQAHPGFGRISKYRWRHQCRLMVGRFLEQERSGLDSVQRKRMVDQVLADALGFGPLDELFGDDQVRDIHVEGPSAIRVNRGEGFVSGDHPFRDLELFQVVVGRLLQAADLPAEPPPNQVIAREAPLTFHMTAQFPEARQESPVLRFRRLRPTGEWQLTHDPFAALLGLTAGERKLRLVCVACARRRIDLFDRAEWRRAVSVVEQYADGNSDAETLQATARSIHPEAMTAGTDEWGVPAGLWQAAYGLVHTMGETLDLEAVRIVLEAAEQGYEVHAADLVPFDWTTSATRDWLPYVLLDVFGSSFRCVNMDPDLLTWRDATIPRLAQAAYEERELPSGLLDVRQLAILADALEEAGCTSDDVLSHLRSPGPHVRGCWVVDLLLGKT